MKFYRMNIDEIVDHFESDLSTGLDSQEAQRRLEKHGSNVLPKKPRDSWLIVFLRQFKNPLVYILLVAACIMFIISEDKLDAFIISGILFFNAIIGTIQEGRTRNIVEKLKHFIKGECIVIRNAEKKLITNDQLVIGDIVLLKEGERVPADVRIFEQNNICIDESALTGESGCITKNTDSIAAKKPVAERNNMAYKGTYVLRGSGKGIVVATGKKTEIGTIQRSIEELAGILPLRKELNRLSRWILIIAFISCVLLFVIGLFTNKTMYELLFILTALFICIIPEGLPVVLTLVLVSGVYRMAKRNILVKNMQSIEALGRSDVIMIDKTGTLTRNEMMAIKIFSDNTTFTVTGKGYHIQGDILHNNKPQNITPNSDLAHIGEAALLLNRSEISYSDKTKLFTVKGDPTEAALYILGKKIISSEEEKLKDDYHLLYEIPFDTELNYHAGFYRHNTQTIMFVIGSPEFIISRSDDKGAESILKKFLKQGLRVIAVGMKKVNIDDSFTHKSEEEQKKYFKQIAEDKGLKFLGICGIQDAIRSEVPPVIEDAREAGLEIVMATGDHKQTALYVAKEVNIAREGDEIIDSNTLSEMPNDELLNRINSITVYARVSPQDKVRIIKAFHEKGKIIAMTGDGVNDVPSMIAADLGIAMGQIGTDIAKEAADIILLNDSFVHIVRGIEQGRHIFYTLRRVILYFFATNTAEILVILFALILSIFYTNLPLPITAVQILWLNFVTDGFLDVALSTEPIEEGIISKIWLKRKLQLIDPAMLIKMIYMAIPMAIGSIWVFMTNYRTGLTHARTMTLITLAMFQWFNAWNCRSEERSIFTLGWFTNKWLIAATTFVLFLQFAVVTIPLLQNIFKTAPLSSADWLLVLAVSSSIIVIEEIRKYITRIFFTNER